MNTGLTDNLTAPAVIILSSKGRKTPVVTRGSASHHHHHGVFDQHLERAYQLGAERAVDGAVIAGQRHAHRLRDLDLARADYRALLAGADGEDRRLRRIDHGGEMID